jgi:hypothetical protein
VIGAIVALAGAIITLMLVRGRDLIATGPSPTAAPATA